MDTLTASEFLDRPLHSLSYYDILPTDGRVIIKQEDIIPLDLLLDELLQTNTDVTEDLLERSLLSLIANPRQLDARMASAADHMSRLYAKLLLDKPAARSHRMRVQLINFCLRDLIERDAPSTPKSTLPFSDVAPWDWLPLSNGEIAIVSGDAGLRWTIDGKSQAAHSGLASQLDQINDRCISVGSIFSPGAFIFDNGTLTYVANRRPIVMIFEWCGDQFAITYDGTITCLSETMVKLQLHVSQVDRVRLLNGALFVSDWTKPDQILIHDLKTGTQAERALDGIILLNDICYTGNKYFAICKQQGHIFAYDSELNPMGKRLQFGRQGLFDPISIRPMNGSLHVLNWVTRTMVSTPQF
jgi:hypothetical protein